MTIVIKLKVTQKERVLTHTQLSVLITISRLCESIIKNVKMILRENYEGQILFVVVVLAEAISSN